MTGRPGSVDPGYVEELVTRLVRINSINPDVDPGGPGEAEIVAALQAEFAEAGIPSRTVEPVPGRPSVVATVRGTGGGRSLMLNAHVDTVGVEGMTAPFTGELRQGRVYGRGAYDMKGAAAACVAAARALRASAEDRAGDVIVALVADEEYASLGTAAVIDQVRTDGAIVTEPTQLKTCLAHKGFVWLEVEVRGRAAHGSRYEDGVDANLRMGRFLGELARLEERIRTGRSHPLVGPGSIHAPILRGGTGISTYADRCVVQLERRTMPGETAAQVEAEIAGLVDRLRGADPTFDAEVRTLLVREPFEIAPDAAVVRAVDAAAAAVLGRDAEHVGDTPWMDSALLAAKGVETVVIGPSGAGAHAAEEWVEVDSVVSLAEILVHAATIYCGEETLEG